MNEPMIHITDLKPGDVLLFKAEEGWISKAISLLTASDVSHSAIYMGQNILSDLGQAGLFCHTISESGETRPIYARRIHAKANLEPVLQAARGLIAGKQPYDMPALVMLGLILLYRDWPIHLIPKEFVTHLLMEATAALDTFINQQRHPGQQPMVCSQYVFQCFTNAGPSYALQVHNGNILKLSSPTGSSLLIDRVNNHIQTRSTLSATPKAAQHQPALNTDAVLQEIVGRLQAPPNLAAPVLETLDEELVRAVIGFSDRWHGLHHDSKGTDAATRLQVNANAEVKAMFVTPADLKSHCTNLDVIGQSAINRNSTPVDPPKSPS